MSGEEFPIYASIHGEIARETSVRLDFRPTPGEVRYRPGDGRGLRTLAVPCHLLGHVLAPEGSSVGPANFLGDPIVLHLPGGEILTAEETYQRLSRKPGEGREEALGFRPVPQEATT